MVPTQPINSPFGVFSENMKETPIVSTVTKLVKWRFSTPRTINCYHVLSLASKHDGDDLNIDPDSINFAVDTRTSVIELNFSLKKSRNATTFKFKVLVGKLRLLAMDPSKSES